MSEVFDPVSGQYVPVTDPIQAAEALRTGKAELPTDKPVTLRSPTGEIVEVDPAQDQDFLRDMVAGNAGDWRLATGQEVEQYDYDQRSGEAFVRGAGRALTLGASDALEVKLSDNPLATREDLSKVREYNPGASMAGEITGDVGSVIVSGGAGLLRAGAQAGLKGAAKSGTRRLLKSLPTAVTAEAAEGVGKAAGRLAGKALGKNADTLLGRVAQGGARVAAEGAVDSAAFTARQLNTEQILTGEDVSGEEALAAFGHDLLYGVAGGALFRGGGALVGSGARAAGRAGKAAGKKLVDLVPKSTRETVQDIYAKVTGGAELSASRADDVSRAVKAQERAQKSAHTNARWARKVYGEEAGSITEEFATNAQLRKAADDPKTFRGNAQRNTRKAVTDFEQAAAASTDSLASKGKSDIWRRTIRQDVGDDVFENASAIVRQGDEVAEKFGISDRGRYKGSSRQKRIQKVSDNIQEAVGIRQALVRDGADAVEQSRKLMEDLDSFKREIGAATDEAFSSGRTSDGETLQAFFDDIRGFLEREDVFGEAARAQREINEKWSEKIAASKAMGLSQRTGNAGAKSKLNAFKQEQEGTKGFAKALVGEAGDLDPLVREKYAAYVNKSIETAEASARWGFKEAEDALPELYKARDALEASLREADLGQEALDKLARLDELVKLSPLEDMSQVAKFLGGALGAGMVLDGVSSGDITKGSAGALAAYMLTRGKVRLKDPVRHMIRGFKQADSATSAGAKTLLEGMGDWLRPQTVKALESVRKTREKIGRAAEAIVKGSKRAGTVAAVETSIASFQSSAQRIYDETEAEGLDDLKGTGQYAANVADAFQRGRQYLREQIPAHALPTPLDPGKVRPVGTYEAWQFAQKVEAVENPLSVVDRLAAGENVSIGLGAMRVVYPKLVEQIKQNVLSVIQAEQKALSEDRRAAIALHFPELAQPQAAPAAGPAQPPAQAPPIATATPATGLPAEGLDSNDKLAIETDDYRMRSEMTG